jgi:hypothetical protein
LDQMHYWLNMFFNYHREEPSIQDLICLVAENKDSLRLLDHTVLVEKCIVAHDDCLEINPSLSADNIPATPSEEFLLSLHIKSFFALTAIAINIFKQNSASELIIYVNNISVNSLRGYVAWDSELSKRDASHLNLLLALFYAGIIFNTSSESNNQIDLHKALDFLNIYATTNDNNAKLNF